MKQVAVASQVKKKIYFKTQKTQLAPQNENLTTSASWIEGLMCDGFFKEPKFDISSSVFKNVKFVKDETEQDSPCSLLDETLDSSKAGSLTDKIITEQEVQMDYSVKALTETAKIEKVDQ